MEPETSCLTPNLLATPPTQHMWLYMGCLPFELTHGEPFSSDWRYQPGLKSFYPGLVIPTGTKEMGTLVPVRVTNQD